MIREIILVVSIIMPGNIPDIRKTIPQDTLDDCWAAARDFVNHDVTRAMRERGALGYGATCAFQEKPSTEQ